jgi:hypothetical protein
LSTKALNVTKFDKKYFLLQSCNKIIVTIFFVTNYLLQVIKDLHFGSWMDAQQSEKWLFPAQAMLRESVESVL